jgi:hypothetical protein
MLAGYRTFSVTALLCSLLIAVAPALGGEDDAVSDAIKELQGRWTMDQKLPNGTTVRVEKEVKDRFETLRVYDAQNQLTYSHQVEFTIKVVEGHRIFAWSNGAVTFGPQRGEAKADGRYTYSLKGDKWYCVHGLAMGDPRPVSAEVYNRVKDDPAAKPAEEPKP